MNKGIKMRKLILAGLLGISLSTPAFAASKCHSDGIRVGTVQKFSKKGILSKSWEGELVMEGVKYRGNAQSTVGGNVWAFSTLDPVVANVISDATMTGQSVALRYCEVYISIGQTDTNYHVTKAVIRSK